MKSSEWKYDTIWNRIITDKNGMQSVVLDKIEPKIGKIIVERANKLIKNKKQ